MHTNDRRGIALVIALMAIVVIGTLIAGVFFSANQEYRIGRNSLIQERALGAAEFGQAAFVRDWNLEWNGSMKRGDVMSRTVNVGNGAFADVRMTRLNNLTFWVTSEGRTPAGATQARRHTGLLLRLDLPQLKVPGAITAASRTVLAGNATVNGNDMNPVGWEDCDQAGPPRAGVVNDVAADVTTQGTGCNNLNCVEGDPKLRIDPTAGHDSTYLNFGGYTFDQLAAMANINIATGSGLTANQLKPSYNADGSCRTGNADWRNWGDIARNPLIPGACERYMPIIHVTGTGLLTVSQGSGQGIMLVEGNIQLNGSFEWYGPILVKGNVVTGGNGNKVFGGIMAMNRNCTTNPCNNIAGTSSLQFSRCALSAPLMMHVRPVVATRSWADMF